MVIKLKERHSDFELLLAYILLYLVVDNNDLIDDHSSDNSGKLKSNPPFPCTLTLLPL